MSEEEREKYTGILASNLPTLRKARRLSQSQLADIVGVARSTIAVIESRREMTWSFFLAVINVFTCHEETRKYMEILGIDLEKIQGFLAGSI